MIKTIFLVSAIIFVILLALMVISLTITASRSSRLEEDVEWEQMMNKWFNNQEIEEILDNNNTTVNTESFVTYDSKGNLIED